MAGHLGRAASGHLLHTPAGHLMSGASPCAACDGADNTPTVSISAPDPEGPGGSCLWGNGTYSPGDFTLIDGGCEWSFSFNSAPGCYWTLYVRHYTSGELAGTWWAALASDECAYCGFGSEQQYGISCEGGRLAGSATIQGNDWTWAAGCQASVSF